MSVAEIAVPMPPEGADLLPYFQSRLLALQPALDLSVVEFDELAQLQGITVEDVEVTPTGVALHYAVAWEAFHACDGVTVRGQHRRLVRGQLEGDRWLFNPAAPQPTRDSADEL
jgi:hypothetical protein